jgi:hypothetical protein
LKATEIREAVRDVNGPTPDVTRHPEKSNVRALKSDNADSRRKPSWAANFMPDLLFMSKKRFEAMKKRRIKRTSITDQREA